MSEPNKAKTISPHRVICVSHIKDVDGCVCAALIKLVTDCQFILTNYGNLNTFLANLESEYDLVYICDLGLNETNLKELRRIIGFADLTYIDHHPLDEDILESMEDMGITVVHSLLDCASVLTFDLFRPDLPAEAELLACYAAVSDRLDDGPMARRLLLKHDRDFIYLQAMMLSYALEVGDVRLKKRVVDRLSALQHPHQIEGVPKLALDQAERIAALRKELPSRAKRLENTVYSSAEGGSAGVIANTLLDVCDADIGIAYNIDQEREVTDISIRGRSSLELDLGEITFQLAKDLGGFGGGHPRASGARIPSFRLKEFIQRLAYYES